jgi:hypothetical protein
MKNEWSNGRFIMRIMIRGIALLAPVLAAGCATQSASKSAAGAPTSSDSQSVVVLKSTPPSDAVRLGTVQAQGTNLDPASCENELISRAQGLGGNAVLPTQSTPSFGRAATCEGTVYRVKK